MARVTFEVPLVDAETLEAFGVTPQDFLDDIQTVVRLAASTMALRFKDALYRELQKSAGAEAIGSLLPDSMHEVFTRWDDALEGIHRICTDEAAKQKVARRKDRDKTDNVLRAVIERDETRRKSRRNRRKRHKQGAKNV